MNMNEYFPLSEQCDRIHGDWPWIVKMWRIVIGSEVCVREKGRECVFQGERVCVWERVRG
jgi:hypothetical protein